MSAGAPLGLPERAMPDLEPPTAAYLYILSLDGPGRAWEYLRRNDAYRLHWKGRQRGDTAIAAFWGLRFP